MAGMIKVDKSSSEVEECSPAKKGLRVSVVVGMGGKTVEAMNEKRVDKSAKMSLDVRCVVETRRRVCELSPDSSLTVHIPLSIGPTNSLMIWVCSWRIGSERA